MQGQRKTRDTAPGDTSLHKIVGTHESLSNNLVHDEKQSRSLFEMHFCLNLLSESFFNQEKVYVHYKKKLRADSLYCPSN